MRLLAVLVVPMLLFAGGAFWETEEPSSWTRDEVDRLLTDSPWAKRADVVFEGSRGGGSGIPGVSLPGGPGGRRGGIGGVGWPTPGQGGGWGLPIANSQLADDEEPIVRWRSAAPLREASGRLEGEAPEAESRRYLVELTGLPLAAAYLAEKPEELRARVRLLLKDGPQLAPERMDILPRPGAPGLLFYFSRERAIALDDRTVEFELRAGDYQTTAKFKLKDMIYRGRLEL